MTVGDCPASADAAAPAAEPFEHLVQFYENDDVLTEQVCPFIGAALGAGEAAVIIATPSHRQSFRRVLSGHANLSSAEADGRFLELDAQETLSRFIRDDVPDADRFGEVVGTLVSEMTRTGRQLRAYGEMVALLQEQGNVAGALRLEHLWNELGRRHRFSLYCAYPLGQIGRLSADPVRAICDTHSHVIATEHGSATLPAVEPMGRRAEQARHHLAAIIDSSDDAIVSKDLEGIVLSWNKAAERMFGYRANEIVGRSILTIIPPDLAHQETMILARIRAGERIEQFETVRRRKDGSLLDVSLSISPIRDNRGLIVGASKIARDISQRKRDLEDIRKAQEANRYLAEVIESADTAIMGVDISGKVNTWNQGAERLFGYSKAEILGQPLETLAPADRRPEPSGILERIKAGERIEPFETVRVHKDGTPIPVSIKVSAVRSSDGSIIGASGIIRDITAEHAARETLREAQETLSRSHEALEARVRERTASLLEAVAQMEEFSYTVSHDLRAPLRAMQAYSKALLTDFGETLARHPEAAKYLGKISGNAQRLDRMILDVLTFSRIARSEMRMQRVALDRLVRETIEHYPDMQGPRARIRVEPLLDVIGHEPSLTQAISNLLTNAVKFVPVGTRPEVRLWTERGGGRIRLWIQDNGIGIEPEYHDRLFKMFERIHPDLSYEGTGVGLAIVRRAVERMGGRVGVESRGRGGSRFWIELKAADPA